MPPRPPTARDDAPEVLGALLHRVASPLGAIANFAHVLPPDELGCRDGLVDAIAISSEAMQAARGWIDAARALSEQGVAPTALGPALQAAVAGRERWVALPDADAEVAAHAGAAAWILDALRAEAESLWPEGSLTLTLEPGDPVRVHAHAASGPAAGDAEQAVPGTASDRLVPAAALARRMGGSVRQGTDEAGRARLTWSLAAVDSGRDA